MVLDFFHHAKASDRAAMVDSDATIKISSAETTEQPQFQRATSTYYYGRPSPFLSNFLFLLNPAPDNLVASNILSAFEMSLGLSLMRIGRRIQVLPNKIWSSRIRKFGSFAMAGHLIFCGGAQCLSNQLNGDDTVLGADAKRQRLKAEREGDPVNWWFGPKYYQYMSSKELAHLLNRSHTESMTTLKVEGTSILLNSAKIRAESDAYFKRELLPAVRRTLNGSVTIDKPPLQLDDLKLDDEEDLNYAWFEVLDPWKDLWQEVNLSINFVPKWYFIEDTNGGKDDDKSTDPAAASAVPDASSSGQYAAPTQQANL